MSKILKFARMDFLAVKPYFLRTTVIMAVVALGLGILQRSPETTVTILGAYTMFFVLVPFSVGEKYNLDRFYSSLAIDRSTVVVGRYAFLLLSQVGAIALSLVLGVALKTLLQTQTQWMDLVASALGIQLVIAVFLAISIPFCFKLGYAKARLMTLLPFIGIVALTPLLKKLSEDAQFMEKVDAASALAENNPVIAGIAMTLVALLIYTLSAAISDGIYAKKEL